MGLDNGFIARGIKQEDIPSFVILPFPNQNRDNNEIEIAYWRKCWGLRNEILGVLHSRFEDKYIIDVDAEDFPAIFKIMIPFFSKEYWEENAESIWEFEEAFEFSLLQQFINLKWLYSYMVEHPEVKCYFYDSY